MEQHTVVDDVTAVLEQQGFEGIDASLDISLFEYGLVWNATTNQVIYVVSWRDYEEPAAVDFATFAATDLEEVLDDVDVAAVAGCAGMSVEEWKTTSMYMQLFDLLQYYGYENIFGCAYYPTAIEDMTTVLTQ